MTIIPARSDQYVNEEIAYLKHKHLGDASKELGIPLSTLYWRLKKRGVAVIGDKERYGGMTDQVGIIGEKLFKQLFPCSTDENRLKFQSDCDFTIKGNKVDIKTSSLKRYLNYSDATRWAFSLRNRDNFCDYFVCFGLDSDLEISKIFLVPFEVVKGMSTLSISATKSKWYDYEVTQEGLLDFFNNVVE